MTTSKEDETPAEIPHARAESENGEPPALPPAPGEGEQATEEDEEATEEDDEEPKASLTPLADEARRIAAAWAAPGATEGTEATAFGELCKAHIDVRTKTIRKLVKEGKMKAAAAELELSAAGMDAPPMKSALWGVDAVRRGLSRHSGKLPRVSRWGGPHRPKPPTPAKQAGKPTPKR